VTHAHAQVLVEADPDGLARAITDHLAWMAMTRYADSTITGRRFYLTRFAGWAAERGVLRPTEVSRAVLERYRAHLFHRRDATGRPMSFRAQYMHLHAIRMLFSWLARGNRVLYNPAADLELPRMEKRLPKAVLSVEEVELVLAQPNLADPLGLRDRAVLEVLYSTAIRRAEAARLSVFDVHHGDGTLLIHGKGSKDRMVPIGDRALAWVDHYLADVRPLLLYDDDQTGLFLNRFGTPMTATQIGARVSAYVTSAKLGKTGGPHLFRHTAATLMLEGGADVRYVQELLGHASLVTTQIYTRVSIRQLKAVHTATHPGAANTPRRARTAGVDPALAADVLDHDDEQP
jgi:integrase/recombinase XerD